MLTLEGQHNIITNNLTGNELQDYYIKTMGCGAGLRQLLMYPYLKRCGVKLPLDINDCEPVEYTDIQIMNQGGTPVKQQPVNVNKLFNKLIGRIHGSSKVSNKVYETIKLYIPTVEVDGIYYGLKRHKMSRYNHAIVYIKYKNNGVPPKLGIEYQEIKDKFRIVLNILNEKNLKLPLMYVMYKLIEQAGRKDILENIHLHSQSKLITYDLRWFDVCAVNDWYYKPTIMI